MNSENVYEAIRREKIIAIVRGVSKDVILDIAESLYAGGIRLLEVTCNTADFSEMVAMLSKEMSLKMTIGAGTVISRDLCDRAVNAGAKYIVAPDTNPEVIEYCTENDIAVIPGAATATEVLTAARLGAKMVKIFPAACIGSDYIKMLKGPIDDVDFVAVGGVRVNNIGEFINAGCIGIGIGGSVIKNEFVERSDWNAISELAGEYIAKINELT